IPLFEFMDDAELYQVARLVAEQWLDDGTFLARQGDRGRELYLVLEGAIEVIKEGGTAWKVVYVAGVGDVVGELVVLADRPRSASLRARGNTKVLTMRGSDFRDLLREHPDLSEQVIGMLTERLAERDPTEALPSD
ncbi:MAG TPA: cyclic nucleotide-binding domain-containing protein, partial [Nitriliruptorales bacterium]